MTTNSQLLTTKPKTKPKTKTKKEEQEIRNFLEKIMKENLPIAVKGNRLPGSLESPKEVGPKEAHPKAHHN